MIFGELIMTPDEVFRDSDVSGMSELEVEFFKLQLQLDYYYFSPDYSEEPPILRLEQLPWQSNDPNVKNLWREMTNARFLEVLRELSRNRRGYEGGPGGIFTKALEVCLKRKPQCAG